MYELVDIAKGPLLMDQSIIASINSGLLPTGQPIVRPMPKDRLPKDRLMAGVPIASYDMQKPQLIGALSTLIHRQ